MLWLGNLILRFRMPVSLMPVVAIAATFAFVLIILVVLLGRLFRLSDLIAVFVAVVLLGGLPLRPWI